MRELQFIAPTELPGYGEMASTVRLGLKWAGFLADERAAEMWLCPEPHRGSCRESGVDCELLGHAVIEEVWTGPFLNVPARIVELEHAEEARHYNGLMSVLGDIYGDRFSVREAVTGIVFRLRRATETGGEW